MSEYQAAEEIVKGVMGEIQEGHEFYKEAKGLQSRIKDLKSEYKEKTKEMWTNKLNKKDSEKHEDK